MAANNEKLVLEMEKRIRDRINKFAPGDPRLKEALFRIGYLLEGQAKINIRNNGLIDTGRLSNSIGFEVERRGDVTALTLGSRGIPYAAIHEFGGDITAKKSRYLTIPLKPEFKGRSAREFSDLFFMKIGSNNFLVQKLDNGRLNFAYLLRERVSIPARPYLRPAIQKHRNRIVQMIRDIFRS